jgi:hypothetical protein
MCSKGTIAFKMELSTICKPAKKKKRKKKTKGQILHHKHDGTLSRFEVKIESISAVKI